MGQSQAKKGRREGTYEDLKVWTSQEAVDGENQCRWAKIEELRQKLNRDQGHKAQTLRDQFNEFGRTERQEILKEKAEKEVKELEQKWEEEQGKITLIDAVKLRETMTGMELTGKAEWPEFEKNWQREEQLFKNQIKADNLALLKKFHQRNQDLSFSTPHEMDAEKQWRVAKIQELQAQLKGLQIQKVKSLQDLYNQFASKVQGQIRKEKAEREIKEFEEQWERDKDNITLANGPKLKEDAARGQLSSQAWWVEFEKEWQRQEEEWKNYLKTVNTKLLAEFQRRDQEQKLSTAEEVNTENEWRKSRKKEVKEQIFQKQREKVQNLQNRLDQFQAVETARRNKEQAEKEIKEFEQQWESKKDTITIVNAVQLRQSAAQGQWASQVWWQEFEKDWQRQEQEWKNLVKTSKKNLLEEFHKRNASLRLEGTEEIKKENEWRAAHRKELDEKLTATQTQKVHSLNNQLVEAQRKHLRQERVNKDTKAWEQEWEKLKEQPGLIASTFKERAAQAGLTTQAWWPRFEKDWQQQEQKWKELVKTDWFQLLEAVHKRTNNSNFATTEERNAENQLRIAQNQELMQKWNQLKTQKVAALQNRLNRYQTKKVVEEETEPPTHLADTEIIQLPSGEKENLPETKKNELRYEYENGLITKITDPLGQTIQQQWYLEGDTSLGAYPRNLKQTTDQRGLVTQYQYDPKGNLTQKTAMGDITGNGESDTATTKFTYTANNLTSASDPFGNEIANFYEDSENPTLPSRIEIKPQGQVLFNIRNTYYPADTTSETKTSGLLQKQKIIEATSGQAIAETHYNEQGLLTSQKEITGTSDPDLTTQFEYNSQGELTKRIDETGSSLYTHDPLKKQIRMGRWDKADHLLTSQVLHYNENGQPTQIEQHGYETISYKYDPLGNLTEISSPKSDLIKMTYDAKGQILSRTTYNQTDDSKISEETFTYEPGGKIASYTNSEGKETKYTYTADGKLRRQENADGTTQEWRYQLDGRPVKEILSDGTTWETAYNDAERTVIGTKKDAANKTLIQESYKFDQRGNIISYTDEKNQTLTRQYDNLNRLITELGSPATAEVAQRRTDISYGNNTATISNHLGEKLTLTKDALGRITSILNQDANGGKLSETTYSYSAEKINVTETKGSLSTTTSIDATNDSVNWTDLAGKFGKQAILAILTVGQAGNLHTANQFALGAIPFSMAFGAVGSAAKLMRFKTIGSAFETASAKAFELVVNNWNVANQGPCGNSSINKSMEPLPF